MAMKWFGTYILFDYSLSTEYIRENDGDVNKDTTNITRYSSKLIKSLKSSLIMPINWFEEKKIKVLRVQNAQPDLKDERFASNRQLIKMSCLRVIFGLWWFCMRSTLKSAFSNWLQPTVHSTHARSAEMSSIAGFTWNIEIVQTLGKQCCKWLFHCGFCCVQTVRMDESPQSFAYLTKGHLNYMNHKSRLVMTFCYAHANECCSINIFVD